MSRQSGHRKSQSTSALSVLADQGARSRFSQHPQRQQHHVLKRVDEFDVPISPAYNVGSDTRTTEVDGRRGSCAEVGVDHVRGWMCDVSLLWTLHL
jgi:hypothetical protein